MQEEKKPHSPIDWLLFSHFNWVCWFELIEKLLFVFTLKQMGIVVMLTVTFFKLKPRFMVYEIR